MSSVDITLSVSIFSKIMNIRSETETVITNDQSTSFHLTNVDRAILTQNDDEFVSHSDRNWKKLLICTSLFESDSYSLQSSLIIFTFKEEWSLTFQASTLSTVSVYQVISQNKNEVWECDRLRLLSTITSRIAKTEQSSERLFFLFMSALQIRRSKFCFLCQFYRL